MTRLERNLVEAQKMEAIGQLAGGIAHDFNNYLAVILGFAEMAFHQTGDKRVKEMLGQVMESSQQAGTLTRQLLAYGRRQPVHLRPVSLSELVEGDRKLLDRVTGEGVSIKTEHEPNLPFAMLDSQLLHQALLNLTINARDAMNGRGSITLKTRSSAPDPSLHEEANQTEEWVRIDISDTGTGIPAGVLEKIFEPFFTTKSVGQGTGLGLPSVMGIVKQNNGAVQVENLPQGGACFSLFFPAISGRHAVDYESGESAPPATGDGEEIWIVEDEPAVAAMTENLLNEAGYRTKALEDRTDALRQLNEGRCPPDAIIADMVMPGITLNEFLNEVRSGYPDLPVLLMTGHAEEAVTTDSSPLSQWPILRKPFSRSDLRAAVRELTTAYPPGTEPIS